MPLFTAVPVHEPPAYRQQVETSPGANLTQRSHAVTPLHYLGEGGPVKAPQKPVRTQPLPPLPKKGAKPLPKPKVAATKPPPKPAPVAVKEKPVVEKAQPRSYYTPVYAAKAGAAGAAPVVVVHFGMSHALVPEPYIDTLMGLDPKKCYMAIGHADPTGGPKWVLGLSIKRAKNVQTVMQVKHLRVKAVGFGAKGQHMQPKLYPEDRHVDVWVTKCTTADGWPGIKVRYSIKQIPGGRWRATIYRDFKTKSAAQVWVAKMTGHGHEKQGQATVVTHPDSMPESQSLPRVIPDSRKRAQPPASQPKADRQPVVKTPPVKTDESPMKDEGASRGRHQPESRKAASGRAPAFQGATLTQMVSMTAHKAGKVFGVWLSGVAGKVVNMTGAASRRKYAADMAVAERSAATIWASVRVGFNGMVATTTKAVVGAAHSLAPKVRMMADAVVSSDPVESDIAEAKALFRPGDEKS